MSIPTNRTARRAVEEVRTMQRGQSVVGTVLFFALIGVLVLGALVASGYITEKAMGDVLMAWGGGIGVVLANLMEAAAVPVILIAFVVLLIVGRSRAIEILITGLCFAVVAGLWHFGAWSWLTGHFGDITSLFLNRTR
jgi:hypothetical protein